jgi:hypothetical protein
MPGNARGQFQAEIRDYDLRSLHNEIEYVIYQEQERER